MPGAAVQNLIAPPRFVTRLVIALRRGEDAGLASPSLD